MLDIQFIRDNSDLIKANNKKRGVDVDVDKLIKTDDKRKKLMAEIEALKAEKNKASKDIPKASPANKKKLIAAMQEVDKKEGTLKPKLSKVSDEFHSLMSLMPNLLDEESCVGKSDKDNVALKEVGDKPTFDFKIKDHQELGELHDLIDTKRAAKVSGSRFGYLKNEVALLELALIQYTIGYLVKQGFAPVLPPVIINADAMAAMGFLEHGGDQEIYHLPKDDQYLVGTSEQAVGPMHMNEIFSETELPKRYVAFSPCFRREAGTYGKDTRGIMRVHQFDKVEMFSFTKPEDSKQEFNYLMSLAEHFMDSLNLPYQVVNICSGDMSQKNALQYDIETWIPSEKRYRETHSISNVTDFQSRRLNTRYKSKEGNKLVHTLNATAITPRAIIAILENNQTAEGTIKIPDVLHPYMHGITEIGK